MNREVRIEPTVERSLVKVRQNHGPPASSVESVVSTLNVVVDGDPAGRKRGMHVVIIVQGEPQLLHVVLTLGSPSCLAGLAGLLHGGQQQCNQDGDDRNDDKQFDQREASWKP